MKERVERLNVNFNEYGVDAYGLDKTDLALMYSLFNLMYKRYFTVTVDGAENIPAHGRGMVVGNHSGGVAIDGAMVLASLFNESSPPRLAHGMAEKFLNKLPFASRYTNRTGNFTGVPEIAEHLLRNDRMLMVFPEGARGTAKLYSDRHTLVRFGSGFVRLALRTNTPIIPFAVIGASDALPTVFNLEKIGKRFGVPYIPITRYLIPLPRRVPLRIVYGKPLVFEGDGFEDDKQIEAHVRVVKDKIRELIQIGYARHRKGLPE